MHRRQQKTPRRDRLEGVIDDGNMIAVGRIAPQVGRIASIRPIEAISDAGWADVPSTAENCRKGP